MKKDLYRPIILGKPLPALDPKDFERKFKRMEAESLPIDSAKAAKDFKKIASSMDVPDNFPDIIEPPLPPVVIASFTPAAKTGTAYYLDVWDADHYDGLADLAHNLEQNRIWFSANGYANWGSRETKTGVINCYFTVPTTRTYRCDARLYSESWFGGPAVVECSMDGIPFGNLNVNGTITQPHARDLSAGAHAFRIKQVSGSFFFLGLTVYAV